MIAEISLRWVVTVLFALSAAECLFEIASGPYKWANVVRNLLHVAMSSAMVVMAWPWGSPLPAIGPLVFFLLAAVWFLAVGFTRVGHRFADGYHALMMLAMAWMYATMNCKSPADSSGRIHGSQHMTSPPSSMPGMDMTGMDDSSPSGDYPAWIGAVNWLCAIGFAIAVFWWLYRLFTERAAASAQQWRQRVAIACQAMMALGMAIMFAVML